MQALAGQEELLRNDAARQQQLACVAASLETFRTCVQHGLAEATFEQRRQLVLLLIDRVVVTNTDVEIRYVLPTSPESEHGRFCQLRKDYFDHPAAPDELEALGGFGTLNELDGLSAAAGERGNQLIAGIAAVGEAMAQPRAQRADSGDGAPSRSCTLASCTIAATNSPPVSVRM